MLRSSSWVLYFLCLPAIADGVPRLDWNVLRREILAASTPVTLITLAPLTNIALLLRTYPEVTRRIARVMTMGGSASIGNASAVAEFNVWHDPEAAAIVFGAGLPLTMYGLDVFYGAALPRTSAAELAAAA